MTWNRPIKKTYKSLIVTIHARVSDPGFFCQKVSSTFVQRFQVRSRKWLSLSEARATISVFRKKNITLIDMEWEGWDFVNRFNHTTVLTPTDRPKLVRTRCVIKVFGGVFCVVRLLFGSSVGVGAFVIGLSQITSFFSLFPINILVPFSGCRGEIEHLSVNQTTWKSLVVGYSLPVKWSIVNFCSVVLTEKTNMSETIWGQVSKSLFRNRSENPTLVRRR